MARNSCIIDHYRLYINDFPCSKKPRDVQWLALSFVGAGGLVEIDLAISIN